MNVLVTGAAGFLGRHLQVRLAEDGHYVHAVDIAEQRAPTVHAQTWRSDIRNRDWDLGVNDLGIDACVHLAAIASPNVCGKDPSMAFETNVRGTANVLGLCRRFGVRKVVFMSSAHTYGISPRYLPTDETHPLALLDTYTTTKVLGEQLCELYWRNHGLSYVALRLYNAYGPGQSSEYFIGRKIEEARAGVRVTMRTPLEEITKDWVSVYDVIDAIVRALQTEFVGPINIGTGVETRLVDIARAIAGAYRLPLVPEDVGDPGPTRMCANWDRAKRVLGWEPKVKFADGLAALIRETR